MAVRVALAEDGFLVLEALVGLLRAAPETDVVAVCRDGRALRRAVEETHPDVVVTDLRMPPSHADEGLRVAVELRTAHPEIGVVLLSAYCEPEYALALLESGSQGRGYLLKERVHGARQLITTIECVARGGSAVDPKIVQAMLRHCRSMNGSVLDVLDDREREVLARMAAGASNAAIATGLGLPRRTVERAASSIFGKLELRPTPDVSRRVHAVLHYLAACAPPSEESGVRPCPPFGR